MKTRGEFKQPGGKTEKEWAAHSYVQLSTLLEVDNLVKELNGRLEKLRIIQRNRQNPPMCNKLILKVTVFMILYLVISQRVRYSFRNVKKLEHTSNHIDNYHDIAEVNIILTRNIVLNFLGVNFHSKLYLMTKVLGEENEMRRNKDGNEEKER